MNLLLRCSILVLVFTHGGGVAVVASSEGDPPTVSLPEPSEETAVTPSSDADDETTDPPTAPRAERQPEADLPEGDEALIAAARAGDLPTVVARLEAGAELDGLGPQGRTALMAAVAGDRASMVEFLLSSGADLEARDASGNTALFFAPAASENMVRRLLGHEARVDVRNRVGHSPLRAAALLGALPAVEALLEAGAPHTQADDGERDALAEAVLGGHFAVADRLREAGATLGRPLGDEVSTLHAAAGRGALEVLAYLLGQGLDPDAPTGLDPHEAPSPLHRAVATNQPEAVKALLAAGADPDRLDPDGLTPLRRAAAEGFSAVVEALAAGKR